MNKWVCPFERIRDYPDCFQDCPDTSECKMKDSWKQIRPLPKLKDSRKETYWIDKQGGSHYHKEDCPMIKDGKYPLTSRMRLE